MSVTRYDVNGPSSVFEDVNGSLVDYKDYAALEAKCAALAAELSAIEAIHNDAVFITDDQYEQCPPQVQKMIRSLAVLQIPAYQSFLAEVRASALPENIAEIIDSGDLETICWQHEHYKAEDYRLSLYRFRTDRAALLQSGQPVSNRDELPLDYLQWHKDGLEWAAQLAKANHPETGDWLYDDPIKLSKAIRKGPDMPELKSAFADEDDNFYSWFGRFWHENYQQNNYTTSAKQMLGTMAEFAFRAGRESATQAGNSPVIPDGYALVPVDITPEQMRSIQIYSELGSYAAANLSGAYSLFREFWDVAIAAAPQQEVK